MKRVRKKRNEVNRTLQLFKHCEHHLKQVHSMRRTGSGALLLPWKRVLGPVSVKMSVEGQRIDQFWPDERANYRYTCMATFLTKQPISLTLQMF